MGQVYIKDIIVDGEKKMIKVVDDDKPCNFCLINSNLKVKDFSSGYDQNGVGYKYDLTSLFNDGFIVSKFKWDRTVGLEAYSYNFNLLARAKCSQVRFDINSNNDFIKFVNEFSLTEENCK